MRDPVSRDLADHPRAVGCDLWFSFVVEEQHLWDGLHACGDPVHGDGDAVRHDRLECTVSEQTGLRLEVNYRMIPAYLGVMLLAFDLFAVSVTLEDWGSPDSLWQYMYTEEKVVYVLSMIVVLAAVMLHLMEMGGPKAFRGKAILTLGATGLLTGFNNLRILLVFDGLSGIFVTFLALSTLFAFAMAITDIVFRSMAKPNL